MRNMYTGYSNYNLGEESLREVQYRKAPVILINGGQRFSTETKCYPYRIIKKCIVERASG